MNKDKIIQCYQPFNTSERFFSMCMCIHTHTHTYTHIHTHTYTHTHTHTHIVKAGKESHNRKCTHPTYYVATMPVHRRNVLVKFLLSINPIMSDNCLQLISYMLQLVLLSLYYVSGNRGVPLLKLSARTHQ